ncbi:hypothetical protein [Bulleidia sp. zg-1006]|uniref:hypothetical protein n=1 Tax=Bulleidia sp. zg-1006 TaxID=2806552 RepID=UPI001939D603|nr:hypothetical protein [Bulleidia sp. zg-1006]QRG86366.1 hypothetical protein JOS54_05795 [Bulleidia sp. zg-1006]
MKINEKIEIQGTTIKRDSLTEFKDILDSLSPKTVVETDLGYQYLDRIEISKEDKQYVLKLVLFDATEEQALKATIEKAKPLVQETLEKMDDDTKQKYSAFYPNYREDKDDYTYRVGDLRSQYGILYRCLKAHKKDYQALPQLLGEYWELVKNKPNKPPFYEADKSYKVGDYVLFGDKVYKRINKNGNDGSPFSDPKNWEEIGKWEE